MKSMFSSASNAISQASAKAKQASITNLSNAAAAANSLKFSLSVDEKLSKVIEKKEPVRVSGLVWKRRGGLGKLASSSSAWELRQMELRGTVLIYYATSEDEGQAQEEVHGSNPKKEDSPRGYLDLAEERAAVQASFGHSGAPSPFCISIIVGLVQETKWKLSFDHHQTQMEWLAAISNAVIQCSVDDYNNALLQAANPNNSLSESSLLRPPPVYEPGGKQDCADHENTSRQTNFHRLWMAEEYTINSKTTDGDAAGRDATDTKSLTSSKEAPLLDNALQVMETLLARKEKVCASMEKKIESLEEELNHLRQAIQDSDTKVAKLSTESESFEKQLGALRQAAQEKDTRIAQISTQKESLEEEFGPICLLVQEKDTKISQISADMESLAGEVVPLREAIHEKDIHIAVALAENKSLEEEVGSLRQSLEEKNAQITEALAEKKLLDEEELGSLHQAIQEKDAQITVISAAKEELLVSMEERLKLQKEELSSLAEEYQKKLDAQEKVMEARLCDARRTNPTPHVENQDNPGGGDYDDEFEDCVES
jgi:2-hydroxy-3-keto-5-methylthiopentenyl-1-phosphate phosphatase